MSVENLAFVSFPIRSTQRRFDIINFLKDFGVLSRWQINQLVFDDSNYGQHKCRTELKKLFDAKLIYRGRCMSTNDYIYWMGKQPKHVEHRLGVNQIYLNLRHISTIFKSDFDFSIGVADAFIVVENRPYFVEYQRAINHSDMSVKIQQYDQYALSRKWDTEGWPMPGKFARVVVVVDNLKDKARIEKLVKVSKVVVRVCLLSEVKDVIK